jgi:hypothetical protein
MGQDDQHYVEDSNLKDIVHFAETIGRTCSIELSDCRITETEVVESVIRKSNQLALVNILLLACF